jgi:mesencephalic astrocyte-derived neurotrophic factor
LLLARVCSSSSLTTIKYQINAKRISVCVKVIEDVRANFLGKVDARNKPAIEKALGDYCKNKDNALSQREKKICYYLDPIKRDVAQPFSLGMPPLKVCERINKTNPEICTVKFPVKTEKMETQDISKLRVKQLKQILADRGVECKGCVEKEEFVKRVQETEHLASDEF